MCKRVMPFRCAAAALAIAAALLAPRVDAQTARPVANTSPGPRLTSPTISGRTIAARSAFERSLVGQVDLRLPPSADVAVPDTLMARRGCYPGHPSRCGDSPTLMAMYLTWRRFPGAAMYYVRYPGIDFQAWNDPTTAPSTWYRTVTETATDTTWVGNLFLHKSFTGYARVVALDNQRRALDSTQVVRFHNP